MSQQIGEFTLKNDEKVNRAVNGSLTRDGKLAGGVGVAPNAQTATAEELDAHDLKVLAEYDKLGGHIDKGGLKVQSGSFYDFRNRRPHVEPKVTFLINVDGEIVEGTEEEAAAVQSARERIRQMKTRKRGAQAEAEEGKLDSSPSGIIIRDDDEGQRAVAQPRRGKKKTADGDVA